MSKDDPGTISDEDREHLIKLRNEVSLVCDILREKGYDELANGLIYRTGYMTGLISRLSASYTHLKSNIQGIIKS